VAIRTHLAGADLAPLLMVYVQLSGDTAALADFRPYITGPWCYDESAPQALKERLYDRLAELLEGIAAAKAAAARRRRR
jgi:hypothetical protein